MIKLYAGYVRAEKGENKHGICVHCTCATSETEAIKNAKEFALDTFPIEEGFSNHEFTFIEVPQEVIDELADQG